jgi:uncharacterized membrane protein YdjX (TVP38/TMEM64 family)
MKFRASLVAACVLLLAAGLAAARIWPHQIVALAAGTMRTTHALGVTGWAMAAAVQTLIALCGILPASIGAFACGAAYGIGGGFLLSASATLAGAMLAFFLSRSIFRPLIVRALARAPRIARLEEGVARDGWRLVALLRCSPVMPFAVTSYAFGLTAIAPRAYLAGTLASLPALLGYVVLGDLTGAGVASVGASQASAVRLALLALAIAATALLTWRIGLILQRALRPQGAE